MSWEVVGDLVRELGLLRDSRPLDTAEMREAAAAVARAAALLYTVSAVRPAARPRAAAEAEEALVAAREALTRARHGSQRPGRLTHA